MKTTFTLAGIALVAVVLVLAAPAHAKVKSGVVDFYDSVSPQPYPAGSAEAPYVYTESISYPDSRFIRIHFAELDLAPGDHLEITNRDGSQRHVYTSESRMHEDGLWALSVRGEKAIVNLYSYGAGGGGYVIDKIARSIPPEGAEAVCGSDGRERPACYGQGVKNITEPVGRVTWVEGFFTFFCTGFLVDGDRDNLVMTNQHCVDSQTDINSTEVEFNFQHANCTGIQLDAISTYAGDDFVSTDVGLDYTLFTLSGNAEANHGEMVATNNNVSVGERMAMPQHSNGEEKMVAVFENAGRSDPCNIRRVNDTISGWDSQSQLNYTCDMEGGASGSPVLGFTTRNVIGINHVETIGCFGNDGNYATEMQDICADAGSLLNCS